MKRNSRAQLLVSMANKENGQGEPRSIFPNESCNNSRRIPLQDTGNSMMEQPSNFTEILFQNSFVMEQPSILPNVVVVATESLGELNHAQKKMFF